LPIGALIAILDLSVTSHRPFATALPMQRHVATADEYVATLEGPQREMVDLLRPLIKQSVPDAREGIKSGTLRYDLGGDLFALAAQKQFFCPQPVTRRNARARERKAQAMENT